MGEMEDAADTPRACAACGGESSEECPWCTSGFQDASQQERWKRFRQRMSKISGTYSIFQGIIEKTIDILDQMDDEEAKAMAIEARKVLCKWLISDHGTLERDDAGKGLVSFHNKALKFLVGR